MRSWPTPSWAAQIGVLVLCLLAILSMPKRSVGDCVRVVPLGAAASLTYNCDTTTILKDALDLQRYIGRASPWRSRPVHIVAIAVLTQVGSPVLLPASRALSRSMPELATNVGGRMPAFLAAIGINFLVFYLALRGLLRLLAVEPRARWLPLALLLATFDVTIGWLYVPHSIMMNLLAPIGAMLSFTLGISFAFRTIRWHVLAGGASAIGALTYGYCLIWPLAYGVGAIASMALWNGARLRDLSRPGLGYAIAFAAPFAVWFGPFHYAGMDVTYEGQAVGQFQWFSDAVGDGRLLLAATEQASAFAASLRANLGWTGVASVALLTATTALAARRSGWRRVVLDPVVLAGAATAVLMLAFNYLQGYHQPRLQVGLLLVPIIVSLRQVDVAGLRNGMSWLAFAISIAQFAAGFTGPAISQT